MEYNKSQLEVANQRLPPQPVIQTFQEKEGRLIVSISSTDSNKWDVSEDAEKSKRLTPGMKIKRSSSVQNVTRKINALFFCSIG